MQIVVKFYKVLGLPSEPVANAFYFIEDEEGAVAEMWLTDADGVPLKAGNTEMILALLAWANITGKPVTFPPAEHNHDDRYFTESEITGASATGSITFTDNPAADETKDINGITVTFKPAPGAFPEVQRGVTLASTMTHLANALNTAIDEELASAEYTNAGGGVIEIVHEPGASGNDFTLTGGTCDFTTSGDTLEGGVTGFQQTVLEPALAGKQTKLYNSWAVRLTQVGTDAPVLGATLEDDITEIVLSYDDVGAYLITKVGAFPAAKWWGSSGAVWDAGTETVLGLYAITRSSDDALILAVSDLNGNPANDLLTNTPIEVRVYL